MTQPIIRQRRLPERSLSERFAYRLGQATTLVVAAVFALLASSLVYVAIRVAWWLTTDHPLVAIPIALAGVLVAGRKL